MDPVTWCLWEAAPAVLWGLPSAQRGGRKASVCTDLLLASGSLTFVFLLALAFPG